MSSQPQFPLYIVSKGRSEYMMTSKALTKIGVRHHIIVEPDEAEQYGAAVTAHGLLATVFVLDMGYKSQYELCDEHGLTKSTGPGPARNFAWDHSVQNGHAWHWVLDDNIRKFRRLNRNKRIVLKTASFWRAMEDFCLRYENVAMAGPNYSMFAPDRIKMPPYVTNTRIYSCNFIRNDLPFRWRGRYNEDTILSLDMLKAGWCTIQFNAFLQGKLGTQKLKGGNTEEFYHKEGSVKKGAIYADTGTIAKSLMQARVHPDVSRVVRKYGRVHHHVDYLGFKQPLIRKKGMMNGPEVNNYGMKLVPAEQRVSNDRQAEMAAECRGPTRKPA